MRGETCDRVVKTKYGKTFGIENTILGMLYYGAVFLASLGQEFYTVFFTSMPLYWIKVIVSGGAALFSVYLTYVQFGILKKWCEYCIASAIISFAIFFLVL